MTRRPLVVFAVLAVLAGGLSACSSGGTASAGASPSSSANVQRALELGRRLAQCARDHGYPNFPDPVMDGNKIVWPVDIGGTNVRDQLSTVSEIPECKAIMDQIQAQNHSSAPITAADLQKLRQFAKCIREHGIPEWPDPKADGTFPISGTPLETEGRSERFMTAVDACKQYYSKRITTS
jgi:hypothetical protein